MSKKLVSGLILVAIAAVLIGIWYLKQTSPELIPPPVSKIQSETEIRSFSYQDILNNPEFRTEMQNAVRNFDQQKAEKLQEKALEIAMAAQLPPNEINLIKGERGLDYMQFLAKRQLFLSGFERRYRQLKGINDIKALYPEANDLFARSDRLITQRDEEIQAIAYELAEGGSIDDYLYLAKQQWLEAVKKDVEQDQ